MKTVVITGSTRGIGYGLALSLLEQGCRVVINGRAQASVQRALDQLGESHPKDQLEGLPADMRRAEQVQELWDSAVRRFGNVDIWVNNAGVTGRPSVVWEQDAEATEAVITANLLGAIYGSQVAVRGMLEQGSGAVYVMEGMGSDGRTHEGLTLYGTTKYALDYFIKGLAQEVRDSNVIAAALRPGMVATEMLTKPYRGRPQEWERVAPIFNIIADSVEDVAEWMANALLTNRRNGAVLSRLSRTALAFRFLAAPFRKRDLFPEFDPSE